MQEDSHAKIIGLSNQIGVRETRRVYGEQWLTINGCMAATIPAKGVFLRGAPNDDHHAVKGGKTETLWQYVLRDDVYGVPYGTLVTSGSNAVCVTGRGFSVTHDGYAARWPIATNDRNLQDYLDKLFRKNPARIVLKKIFHYHKKRINATHTN